MKRLLVFHPAPAPYRVDFFNELGRRFCLHVVFLRRDAREILVAQKELLEGATFTYEYLPFHFRLFGRDMGFGYSRILRRFRPDAVVATEFSASLLMPLLLRRFLGFKYKVLTQCDDSIYMAEARTDGRRRRADWMLQRADGIVTISREVSEWYLQNTPIRRAVNFPIIHDETVINKHRDEILARAEDYISFFPYEFPYEASRVGLFVGRFVEVKNLPLLIRMLAEVSPQLPDNWQFVFVGDGEEYDALRQQVEESGLRDHVFFAALCRGADLFAWYAVASFLVLPSKQEAFGAVIGEALQMGCRALVSKYAGGRCLISDRGMMQNGTEKWVANERGVVFSPDESETFRRILVDEYRAAKPVSSRNLDRRSLMKESFSEAMTRLEKEILEIISTK